MNKKLIKLTESDLHRIVKESVQKILNEVTWTDSKGNIHKDQHGTDPEAWDNLEDERMKRTKVRAYPTLDQAIETDKNFSGIHRNKYNAASLRGNSNIAKLNKNDADYYRDKVKRYRGMKNG